MIPLFRHQEDAVRFLTTSPRSGSGALFHDMGLGKTRTALELYTRLKRDYAPKLRLLVVAPLSLLEAAWGADIERFYGISYWNLRRDGIPREGSQWPEIFLCNYEWIVCDVKKPNKNNQWVTSLAAQNAKAGIPWMLVADECFSGETMIKTIHGEKRIDKIRIGDFVRNCLGWSKVLGTKIKKLDSWIKICYNDKKIKCSPNHPFFTEKGWKLASQLKKGDFLVSTNYAEEIMSILPEEIFYIGKVFLCEKRWGSIDENFSKEALLRNLLLGEMENEAAGNKRENLYDKMGEENFCDMERKIQNSRSCCGKSERKNKKSKPHFVSDCTSKNFQNITTHEMETCHPRREWETRPNSSIKIVETSGENVAHGICIEDKSKTRMPKSLQNRFGVSIEKDRNRSGWIYPFGGENENWRFKKREIPKFYRVEAIEIQKQRGDGFSGESIEENIFYDLEIENHPSFSVNGALVHNSSRMKNQKSLTSKTLLRIRDLFRHRIVMSGTPAPNSELEYWAQMEFVRPGLLHPSFYAFRNTFFHLENKYTRRVQTAGFMTRGTAQDMFRKGWGYSITNAKRREFITRIEPWCHRARKEDCLDLPPQTDEIRLVMMAPNQRRAYLDMKRHLVAEIRGQQIAAQVALAKIMKLRQCSSGFFYNASGDSIEINERRESGMITQNHVADGFKNSKLKELLAVIDEAGPQPIIVWIQFHWELIKICHELHKLYGEDQVVTLSALTEDKDGSIAAFRDGKARFLVAHGRSGGHGLTFINCSLQVFFSLDFSWEIFEQCKARIHRPGQTKPCTYVYLLAKDTIDEDILAVLRRKGDAQEVLEKLIKEPN